VRSIVGRYLEHARAFYFQNSDGEPLIYAGSADWMPRNFFRRIEVLYPIEDPDLRNWVSSELFPIELADTENARELQSNGAYVKPRKKIGQPPFAAQTYFIASAAQRART
jgi:polyphosphate kinase